MKHDAENSLFDFSHLYSLSTKAPVGQTSIQAPQNSHPDSNKEVPFEVPTKETPDLETNDNAESILISSHTLTHLAHTIHKL